MKDFGILFKTLRKNAAFTQKEIADKLGIDSTSVECDDATPVYDNSQETEPIADSKVIMQKRKLFTPKRILLACILVMVLVVNIFVYTYTHADFKFIEARTNVETQYGPAYELVYCHKTKHPDKVYLEHAEELAKSWRDGEYTDCTEDVLIVSYFLSLEDANSWNDVFFRCYYLNNPIQ